MKSNTRTHRRSLDVEEALIWAYQEQLVLHARSVSEGERRAWLTSFGEDSMARVERIGRVGTSIDTSPGAGAFDAHPDAEQLHSWVRAAGGFAASLLMAHSEAATRPDWKPGGVEIGPVWRYSKARLRRYPAMFYDSNRNTIGCLIQQIVSAEAVELARRTYELWHAGLRAVYAAAAAQPDALKNIAVTAPAAPAKPWTDPREVIRATIRVDG